MNDLEIKEIDDPESTGFNAIDLDTLEETKIIDVDKKKDWCESLTFFENVVNSKDRINIIKIIPEIYKLSSSLTLDTLLDILDQHNFPAIVIEIILDYDLRTDEFSWAVLILTEILKLYEENEEGEPAFALNPFFDDGLLSKIFEGFFTENGIICKNCGGYLYHFALLNIDARNYLLSYMSVESILGYFVENTQINQESLSFLILAISFYELEETDAHQIAEVGVELLPTLRPASIENVICALTYIAKNNGINIIIDSNAIQALELVFEDLPCTSYKTILRFIKTVFKLTGGVVATLPTFLVKMINRNILPSTFYKVLKTIKLYIEDNEGYLNEFLRCKLLNQLYICLIDGSAAIRSLTGHICADILMMCETSITAAMIQANIFKELALLVSPNETCLSCDLIKAFLKVLNSDSLPGEIQAIVIQQFISSDLETSLEEVKEIADQGPEEDLYELCDELYEKVSYIIDKDYEEDHRVLERLSDRAYNIKLRDDYSEDDNYGYSDDHYNDHDDKEEEEENEVAKEQREREYLHKKELEEEERKGIFW